MSNPTEGQDSGRQPPVDYIERTRAVYSSKGYAPYQWVRNEPMPLASTAPCPNGAWGSSPPAASTR